MSRSAAVPEWSVVRKGNAGAGEEMWQLQLCLSSEGSMDLLLTLTFARVCHALISSPGSRRGLFAFCSSDRAG